ncbi:hypothetical protein [Spongorhabdus nitratireducens]
MACKGLLLFLFFAQSSAAAYLELRNEIEHYSGHYHGESNTMPFLMFSFEPISDSPLWVEGFLSYNRRYGDSHRQNDFGRHDLYLGYPFDFGKLKLFPMAGFRYEDYRSHKKSTEYRFFPQFDYWLSDSTRIRMLGFVAPMNVKDLNRKPDPDFRFDNFDYYGDYRHELEFGLEHKLPSHNAFRVSFYSEVLKMGDVTGSSEKLRNEGQLRVIYMQQYEHYTFKPWVRVGLYRIKKNAIKQQKDEIRHRVGFDFINKFAENTEFISRFYFQQEDKQTWKGKYIDHKNRTFVRLGVRRYF